jgi:hypothetical protein
MGVLNQLLYGPNVALALLGGAGVKIEQANLPITAGEFVKTSVVLAVGTAILGYVLLRAVTGAALGAMIGPLAYWGYLGGKRDATRRAYQEALARVATIARDVIGRGGSLKETITAVAQRGPRAVQGDFQEASVVLASGRPLEKALEAGERAQARPGRAVPAAVGSAHRQRRSLRHAGHLSFLCPRAGQAILRDHRGGDHHPGGRPDQHRVLRAGHAGGQPGASPRGASSLRETPARMGGMA